ncbi:MAG: hypothetical protein HDR33_05030 [Treponema sp.]|nr:hypothetical protein [Treponema sp.]
MNIKKISFFDKKLLQNTGALISIFASIATLVFVFIKLPDWFLLKLFLSVVLLLIILCFHFYRWSKANNMSALSIKIRNTNVKIDFVEDIFTQSGIKIIACNEYFDTRADDVLVSKASIHGQFLEKISDENLETKINNDLHLAKLKSKINNKRVSGNKQSYKLGSIFKYELTKETDNTYFLVAFSKVDEDNKAIMSIEEYITSLIRMWHEIDCLYSGRAVVMPLIGNGITRIEDYKDISAQEKLELLLRTLKFSGNNFRSGIHIALHNKIQNDINLYRIKDTF